MSLPFDARRAREDPAEDPGPATEAATEDRPESWRRPDRPSADDLPKECTYVTIFGQKGMGKTLLARQIFTARERAGASGIFLDKNGVVNDLAPTFPDVASMWRHLHGRLTQGRPFNVVLQPVRFGDTAVDDLWPLVYELGDLLLVVDEAQTWADAHSMDPGLGSVVATGRNRRIDLVTTVRSPPELNKRVKGTADVAVTFRQPLRDYAKQVNRRYFYLDGGEEIIMQLPRFHYLRAEHDADPRVTYGVVQI